jgi:hypothetical protein
MSASNDGEEDHSWPAFVDALTTMVMILTFVMLILAVAMASMMENVSKHLIQKIADVVHKDTKFTADTPAEEMAERIIETFRRQQESLERTNVAGRPPESVATEERVLTPPPTPTQGVQTNRVATRVANAALTLTFEARATRIDDATQAQIREYIEGQPVVREAGRIEVRAFASTLGALSEARRVAFYRGMLVRGGLVAAGIPADRIVVRVDPTANPAEADQVRVFPGTAAN